MEKMWAGRFEKEQAGTFNEINYSINEDFFLLGCDVFASKAHAQILEKIGILSEEELENVKVELDKIAAEWEAGELVPEACDEDVHMMIERKLTEKLGDVGKKIHTGRSRNDQTVTALKLWVRGAVNEHIKKLEALLETILQLANENIDVLLAGSTHLQAAQPISLAFYFMNYAEKLKRDKTKLEDALKNMDTLPLGSGALAGVNYELDRELCAELTGFSKPCANAMDGVSDRDFVCDYLYCLSICHTHLSQLAEDFIIWNSPMYSYITVSDEYSSGSSIMPQKKNPDAFELIRGKASLANARLNAMLGTLKGLAMSYNKDLQSDKKLVYDAYSDFSKVLEILPNMLKTVKYNGEKMMSGLKLGYVNATDLADELTAKGVPFRQAHEVVGKLVKFAVSQAKALEELDMIHFKEAHSLFDSRVYEVLDYKTCINKKKTVGSTNPNMVKKHIEEF